MSESAGFRKLHASRGYSMGTNPASSGAATGRSRKTRRFTDLLRIPGSLGDKNDDQVDFGGSA